MTPSRKRKVDRMRSFTTPLVVSPMPDGRKWRLVYSFRYRTNGRLIAVPSGFITDFASVPFPLWWLIPSWGKDGKAAVVHDYLYQEKTVTRKEADDIFREAMIELGVSGWRVFLMYWAVRLFGWMAWK